MLTETVVFRPATTALLSIALVLSGFGASMPVSVMAAEAPPELGPAPFVPRRYTFTAPVFSGQADIRNDSDTTPQGSFGTSTRGQVVIDMVSRQSEFGGLLNATTGAELVEISVTTADNSSLTFSTSDEDAQDFQSRTNGGIRGAEISVLPDGTPRTWLIEEIWSYGAVDTRTAGVFIDNITVNDVLGADVTYTLTECFTSECTGRGEDRIEQNQNIFEDFVGAWSWQPLSPELSIASAVLPASRASVVGQPITAFVTAINSSSEDALDCVLQIPSDLGADVDFSFRATDASTNEATTAANVPVDIAAGAAQSFLIEITPLALYTNRRSSVAVLCGNKTNFSIPEVNTFTTTSEAVQGLDIIALLSDVELAAAIGTPIAFAAATANVSTAAGSLLVTAEATNAEMDVSISLCQTNPTTGECINPTTPSSSAMVSVGASETSTFSVFVTANSSVVANAATNRIRLNFADGSTSRGSTSTAFSTN